MTQESFGDQLSGLFRTQKASANVLVYSLWSLTPLSWTYVLWSILHGSLPQNTALLALHAGLFSYALLEVLFSIYYRYLALSIQRRRPWEAQTLDFLREVLIKSLESGMGGKPLYKAGQPPSFVEHKLAEDDERAIDFRQQLRHWFLGARFEEIKRDNVRDWILWSMFSKTPAEFWASSSKEERDFVEEVLDMLEARAGKSVPDGRNPRVKSLRLTIDHVRVSQRPLFLYAAVNFIGWLIVRDCKKHGFKQVRHGDFEYLVRPATSGSDKNPVVFLHGLGIGLGQYSDSLDELATNAHLADRTLIVPRQPHISQEIFHKRFLSPPDRPEFVANLSALVKRLGIDGPIDVLSHSNGTSLLAWILKTPGHSMTLGRVVFVDPVCFCLWEPDIPHSFLYKPATEGIEVLMSYFVARELGTANLLQRHFDWTSNLLWAEEVDGLQDRNRVLIVLAGQDKILNARRVERYLKAHGVKDYQDGGSLLFAEHAAHGEGLTAHGPILKDVVEWLASPEAELELP